jgi:hypothetical protein
VRGLSKHVTRVELQSADASSQLSRAGLILLVVALTVGGMLAAFVFLVPLALGVRNCLNCPDRRSP